MIEVSVFFLTFGERKDKIMANKRILKRTINTVCDELFAECVAASLYGGTKDKENAESLLLSVISMRNDFIGRVCHPEPGWKQKEYFRQLIRDFGEEVHEVADCINNVS